MYVDREWKYCRNHLRIHRKFDDKFTAEELPREELVREHFNLLRRKLILQFTK